jgi:6-pyruvoyltetrahydropterin/6-carboxytetrahydropterin synthase
MLLRKTFRFEASHILPKHPGKCSRLHGHSWVLHVFVEGEVDEKTGFVQDFADISKIVKPLIERLDHHHLGTIEFDVRDSWKVEGMPYDLYPSSENLLLWIGNELLRYWDHGNGLERLDWSKLAIEETCTSYAELTREEFDATWNKS